MFFLQGFAGAHLPGDDVQRGLLQLVLRPEAVLKPAPKELSSLIFTEIDRLLDDFNLFSSGGGN